MTTYFLNPLPSGWNIRLQLSASIWSCPEQHAVPRPMLSLPPFVRVHSPAPGCFWPPSLPLLRATQGYFGKWMGNIPSVGSTMQSHLVKQPVCLHALQIIEYHKTSRPFIASTSFDLLIDQNAQGHCTRIQHASSGQETVMLSGQLMLAMALSCITLQQCLSSAITMNTRVIDNLICVLSNIQRA